LPDGVFYGFPQIDELGVKVAEHSGGEVITDPKNDPRPLDPADLARVEAFLTQYMPGVGRPMQRRSVCFYTMSPDENFVIDRHPRNQNVFFTAGLSGHGFKFTSVLGEVMGDLALAGKTDLPVGFLGLKRFAE
jgi:glycine/D-amino acid oxidase-like deaminating enzyme